MHKRFVYFDLGNVLVNFDHEIGVSQLAALAKCSSETVRATVFDSDLQTRFETGLISGSEFTAEVNQQLGTQLATADVMEAISAIFEPNTPILAALERVQRAGVPMGVLSNTCDAHWYWLKRKQWPMLGEWFHHAILSYEVRSMKPHGGIYEASERQAGCAGGAIFFTDDRADNIAAAAERGWATHCYAHYRTAVPPAEAVNDLLHSLDRWLTTSSVELSSV